MRQMSGPPPDDLDLWSKAELVEELKRQQAINREHASRTHGEARREGSRPPMLDFGSPHSHGGVIIDARGSVLMDAVDVCQVDTWRGGKSEVVLAMTLAGRVNFSTERSETMYMFDADGAAAIVSELIALAGRIGPEFAVRLQERLEAMP
jgi:hypothetical protein